MCPQGDYYLLTNYRTKDNHNQWLAVNLEDGLPRDYSRGINPDYIESTPLSTPEDAIRGLTFFQGKLEVTNWYVWCGAVGDSLI